GDEAQPQNGGAPDGPTRRHADPIARAPVRRRKSADRRCGSCGPATLQIEDLAAAVHGTTKVRLAPDFGDTELGAPILSLALFGLVVGNRLLFAEPDRDHAILVNTLFDQPTLDCKSPLARELLVVGVAADVVGVPFDSKLADLRVVVEEQLQLLEHLERLFFVFLPEGSQTAVEHDVARDADRVPFDGGLALLLRLVLFRLFFLRLFRFGLGLGLRRRRRGRRGRRWWRWSTLRVAAAADLDGTSRKGGDDQGGAQEGDQYRCFLQQHLPVSSWRLPWPRSDSKRAPSLDQR